ncbi:hypothetical protein M4914_17715 [Streptomyces somaliensis DSM 40738]|uniref:Uncharacterized protein n=1 Tax=Streptomyces somaliensis (strain ATCC 33201 / DSM 40738 / JCM 12659 / KCTC 9044 / NCTC 11332 / NRRL B-12077 / IP 733) TaxID=1134445 RepID=A0AA44IBM2_STRE0|nr:hypothetical protein [Streptomyces somaliensis]MCQ0024612.1 hypothetical protein [Streptomyces somaliensis DSM 40738]NKY12846.1 hypothetical protein [Streptomyces somaliensis DSM 40738]
MSTDAGEAAWSADPPGDDGRAAPASAPAPAPTTKAGGTVRREGAVVIVHADDEDLDGTPPTRSEIDEENGFPVLTFTDRMLRPEHGVGAASAAPSAGATA